MAMASSPKLPLFLLLLAAFLATVVAVPTPAPAPAQQEYCGDSLMAGLMECRSFIFGGTAAPSPACCAAYEAVYAAECLCLCYLDDGTFWRAHRYDDDANAIDSFRIPASCGQDGPPIEFWCEETGLELPPYGPQGTSAQPPAAAAAPTA